MFPASDAQEEVIVHAGLHALGWGLQRFAVGLVVVALLVVFAYAALVTAIVVGQAFSGQ